MTTFSKTFEQVIRFTVGTILSFLSLMALIGLFFYDFNLKNCIKWISEKYLEWFISQSISGIMQPQIHAWYKAWSGRGDYYRLMEEGQSGVVEETKRVVTRQIRRVTWV